MKNVLKWGYHENRDISDISANYQKSFSEKGMKGLHFFSISFFVEAEYTAKSDVVGGGDFGFS
jgi:hypothetical protein